MRRTTTRIAALVAGAAIVAAVTATLLAPCPVAGATDLPIFPVGSWQVVGPYADRPDLNAVDAPNSYTACVVGDRGSVAMTTDWGVTWSIGDAKTAVDLHDVAFADATTGWIVGAAGVVRRTTDGGATWLSPSSGVSTRLNALAGTGDDLWAVGSGGVIRHSSDGGATWSGQTSPTAADLHAADFVDAQTGWAVGAAGTIVHTTDGGSTWVIQTSPTTADLTAVSFDDAASGCAVGQGAALETTDGGSTWVARDGIPDLRLTWCRTIAGGYWSACGEAGFLISRTNDGSLYRSSAGFTATINDRSQVDYQGGYGAADYLVGDRGLAIRFNDYGQAEIIDPPFTGDPPDLNALAFGTGSAAWVTGDGGTILHTSDGGATWSPQTSGATFDLLSVTARGASRAWACGEGATVLSTTDGGATWTPCAGTLPDETWVSIACAPPSAHPTEERLWVASSQGTLCYTSNGGASWQTQLSGLGWSKRVRALSETDAWLAGAGEPRFTTDAGQSWQSRSTDGGSWSVVDLVFADSQHGWLAQGWNIFATTSGGHTPGDWSAVFDTDPAQPMRIATWDGGTFWGTSLANVWSSDDGGWVRQTTGTAYALNDVVSTGAQECWAVGDGGTLLHTTDRGNPDVWAPVTTCSQTGVVYSNQDVAITLDTEADRSGIARTEYQIDAKVDSGWVTGTSITVPAPATHENDGIHAVYYRSVDGAGNVETARKATVIIDTVAPDAYAQSVPEGEFGYWRNVPLKVLFAAVDPLSTPWIDYRLDAGAWVTTGKYQTIEFPADPDTHADDGEHTVVYRPSDTAGNVGVEQQFQYWVDTVLPVAKAPSAVSVRRGSKATIPFRINDALPCSGRCAIGIYIVDRQGRLAKRILPNRWYLANTPRSVSFTCRLAKGTYRFYVVAGDGAGNSTAKAASNRLTVR